MSRLVSLLICIYSASLLLWVAAPSLYDRPGSFGEYLTISSPVDHDEAARRLTAGGAASVVTPGTTQVVLSRFSGTEQVPLTEALDRLDPLDPRLDPWITGLQSYFFDGDRPVLYADLGMGPWRAQRLVRELLGPGAIVSDLSRTAGPASLFLLLLCAGVLSSRTVAGGVLRSVVLPALPWIPVVLGYGLVGAAGAALVILYVCHLAPLPTASPGSSILPGREQRLLLVLLLATVSGYGALFGGGIALLAVAVALSGSLAIALVPTGDASATTDPDHKPFRPLSLMSAGEARSGSERTRVAVAAVLLLLAPPLLDTLLGESSATRPVPVTTGELSALSIGRLWDSGVGELPDLADYLAHRAYQEGFPYGRSYGVPRPGERVELARFNLEPDGSYSSRMESVIVFDEGWFQAALDAPSPGIASVLVSLGQAAAVVSTREQALYSGILRVSYHALLLILALLPALYLFTRRARLASTDPIYLLLRRKGEAV